MQGLIQTYMYFVTVYAGLGMSLIIYINHKYNLWQINFHLPQPQDMQMPIA